MARIASRTCLLFLLLGASLTSILPSPALGHGMVLLAKDVSRSGGMLGRGTTISFRIEMKWASTGPVLARIFDWTQLTAAQSNMTFIADAGTDRDFTTFASLMSDGLPSWWWNSIHIPGAGGSGSGEPNPEFSGVVIDHVELRVGEIRIESPGRDPNHDGNWTDYDFPAVIELHGEIATSARPVTWGTLKRLYHRIP